MLGLKLNRHQTILGVYVNKFGKTSVVWRYISQQSDQVVLLLIINKISYNNEKLFFCIRYAT